MYRLRLEDPRLTACVEAAADGALPTTIKLMPFGVWLGHPSGPFAFGSKEAAEVVANFQAMGRDLVIDYDHQTVRAEWNGQKAPAAGWIDRLEVREDGLYGHVRMWTPQAAEHLKAKEYRYLSPTLIWNRPDKKTGTPTGAYLHSVALTNTPFLDELPALVASDTHSPGGSTMLTLLLASLGLPEKATQAEAETKINALKADAQLGVVVRRELNWTVAPANAEAELVGTLKHSGYVSFAEHAKALADNGAQMNALSDESVLEKARREGKLVPAQDAWAQGAIKRDRAGFMTWLSSAPQVVPVTAPNLNGAAINAATTTTAGDDAVEQSIAKQLGITVKQMREVQ